MFQSFNTENLSNAICEVTGGLYEQTKQDVERYVKPRLDFMYEENSGIYFIFEDKYVETEWKDMISVHYINTSYEVKASVMRVHLFQDKSIHLDSYLGCFTLRTIDDVRFMLSYIYPNWKRMMFRDKSDAYVMTYKKKVHIRGKEIEFFTYPLFVQDNAVIKCAQADMIAMSCYLHAKYDYSKIRILNLNESSISRSAKVFPSKGLTPPQMLEVFRYFDISAECRICYKEADELKKYIDSCVESAIPVLLGLSIEDKEKKTVNKHVVQIIGHSLQQDKEKKYIVYDDSGYYFRNVLSDGFVKAVSWEELCKKISPSKSFVMYPIHEKIYMLYDDIEEVFDDMFQKLELQAMMEELNDKIVGRRILIVDNRRLKEFLEMEIVLDNAFADDDEQQESIEEVKRMSLPHYLWYCEYQTAKRNLLFFANPTYNNKTTKDVIINKKPIISKNVLGLLSEIKYSG